MKQAAFVLALAVGVTVGGVAAGALVLAPAVAEATQPGVGPAITSAIDAGFATTTSSWRTLPEPVRRLALPVLLGALALTGFTTTAVSLIRHRPSLNARSKSASRGSARAASRTPRAVQAMAESGAEPSEIAWRTGLPLDAVAMLLSLSSPTRQLRPPTA